MLKALLKSIRGSSSPELKILSPNLEKVLSKKQISESSFKSFIHDLENDAKLDSALSKLLKEDKLPQSELKLLQNELNKSKGISSAMVIHSLLEKSHSLENLKLKSLPKDAEELNKLIMSNKMLKDKTIKFIKLIKKHKIKLSLITLTLATAGNYLFNAAHNLSGCYGYQITPSGEYKLICKVKNCNENNDKESSINGVFCDEVCLSGSCSEKTCIERTSATIKYTCVNLHWYDVLSLATKQLTSSVSNFFTNLIKYIFVFLTVFCTYSFSSSLNQVSRIAISFVVFLILLVKFF